MFAGILVDPLQFLLMAGAALFFGGLRQLKRSNGHMGVGMTTEAVFQLEVGCAFMASRTLRYAVGAVGKVLHVAVEAGNFRFVFTAVGGDPLCDGQY